MNTIKWGLSPNKTEHIEDMKNWVNKLKDEQLNSDRIVICQYLGLAQYETYRTLDILRNNINCLDHSLSTPADDNYREMAKKDVIKNWRASMSSVVRNTLSRHEFGRLVFPLSLPDALEEDDYTENDLDLDDYVNTSNIQIFNKASFSEQFFANIFNTPPNISCQSRGYCYLDDSKKALMVLEFYKRRVKYWESRYDTYKDSKNMSNYEVKSIINSINNDMTDELNLRIRKQLEILMVDILNRYRIKDINKKITKKMIRMFIYGHPIMKDYYNKNEEYINKLISRFRKDENFDFSELNKSNLDSWILLIDALEHSNFVSRIVKLFSLCIFSDGGYRLSHSNKEVEGYVKKLDNKILKAKKRYRDIYEMIKKTFPEVEVICEY